MTRRIEPKSKLAKAVKNLEVVADQLMDVAKALSEQEPATYPSTPIAEFAAAELEALPKVKGRKKAVEPKPKEEKPIYRTYEDFPYEKLVQYAGLDCIATSGVLSTLFPALVEEPTLTIADPKTGVPKKVKGKAIIESVENTEMLCHEFIISLEINGMRYDVDKNRAISRRMVAEIDEFEDKIFSAIGKRINLDSGVEVANFLYNECGFVAPFQTKSGEPAVDGDALLTLAGLDPKANLYVASNADLQFLADMAKRKDINSVHNTFIKTYVEDFVKRDGRIHPSYNLHGTSSFRITGDNPNLTQLPRPKHGYNVRECYTVDSGNVFIAFDFSSAEVKILGAICRDKNMLKAIAEGLDFHSFSASAMMGVPYDEYVHILEDKSHALQKEYKRMRQVAKTLTFSILYGSSAGGIAMQLSISKDEAERLMNMYFKAYPGVKDYIEESHNMAIWNQKVWTPFGQYKHEYAAHPVFKKTAVYNAALRNAQNVRIQSATSTLGLVVFAHLASEVERQDPRNKAICTVYDSVEFEVPIENAAQVINTAFYYMNDWPLQYFDWLDLPIGVEGEIGFNWGEVEQVKPGVTQEEVEMILKGMR
ncbi:DNA polymerase I, thermostable [compost metagenome]